MNIEVGHVLLINVHAVSHDGSTDADKNRAIANMFIPLSDSVTACTAHPLDGTLVAGTKVCV